MREKDDCNITRRVRYVAGKSSAIPLVGMLVALRVRFLYLNRSYISYIPFERRRNTDKTLAERSIFEQGDISVAHLDVVTPGVER